MPVTYSISSKIIWLRVEGIYATEEVQRAFDSAFEDPQFVKGMPLLIDIREAESNFTVDDIKERADYYASLKKYIAPRCAIVASKALLFGMSKVFEVFANRHGFEVHVTAKIDEAFRYLSANPDA